MDLLYSCYAHAFSSAASCTECSILQMVSSESSGFIKCCCRCLSLNLAKASQSQRTCVAISDVWMHLSLLGVSANPFKWLCPLSSPIIFLSWYLLKVRFPSSFITGSFMKTLSLPLNVLPVLLLFCACPVPDHSPCNLYIYAKGRLRPCEWVWAALPS